MREQAVMFIYTAGRKANMIKLNGNKKTGRIKKIIASNKQSGGGPESNYLYIEGIKKGCAAFCFLYVHVKYLALGRFRAYNAFYVR